MARGKKGREKCDCGDDAHARGMCQRHYRQWWRNEQRARECQWDGCGFGKEPGTDYCVTHGPEMEMRQAVAALKERGLTTAALTHYGRSTEDESQETPLAA